MAKPPDRRFDDSPFSGTPPSQSSRRQFRDASRDDLPQGERPDPRARRDSGHARDPFGTRDRDRSARANYHPDPAWPDDRRRDSLSERSRPLRDDRDRLHRRTQNRDGGRVRRDDRANGAVFVPRPSRDDTIPAGFRSGDRAARDDRTVPLATDDRRSRDTRHRDADRLSQQGRAGRFHPDPVLARRDGDRIPRDNDRGRGRSRSSPEDHRDTRTERTATGRFFRAGADAARPDRGDWPDDRPVFPLRQGDTRRLTRAAPANEPTLHWPVLADDSGAPPTGAGDGDRNGRTGKGPGGRTLAVAAVLFLVVSVVAAGASNIFDGPSSPTPTPGNDVAAAAPSDIPVSGATAVASGSGGPLVSFGSAASAPTATLPPAGKQQKGYAGSYLDGVRTVCIDPGHGGPDRGRTFAGDDQVPPLEEATYTLKQGLKLRDLLTAQGIVVVMTRTTDQAVNVDNKDVNGDGKIGKPKDHDWIYDELQARINICNAANADLMISIHINGYDNGKPSGYESWYTADRPFGDQSAVFAQLGVKAIGDTEASVSYAPENRGAKDDGAVDVDSSNTQLASHMLLTGPAIPGEITPSNMPGAIMESLFITNRDEQRFLLDQDSTTLLATAYATAIEGYFSRYQY